MVASLYIHIPFCAAKCSYCSFNSYAGLEALQERYVDALCAEMADCASAGHQVPLETVFLGGGTPTLLPAHLLREILSSCRSYFPFAHRAEVSIEANPGTVDREKFSVLHQCGVNRLSIGVQSFNDRELQGLGRLHSAKEARVAVALARESGFDNLSLDLMYGLPGQDAASWRASLETALSLGPQHLSLYQLTLEEGTPLQGMLQRGETRLPDDRTITAMDEITTELTAGAGLPQYEISNYAGAGHQCRHNINYWENGEYFGFGAGAVAYWGGRRRRNISSPRRYCQLLAGAGSVIMEEESLDREASFRETVIMGLRMNRGLALRNLEGRFGMNPADYYGAVLQSLLRQELLEEKRGFLRLTDRGRSFANRVMAELV